VLAVVALVAVVAVAPISNPNGRAASPPAELVSTLDGSTPLPRDDYWPSVSGDGQIVVFTDYPPTGGEPEPPFDPHVYVRDRLGGSTVPVAVLPGVGVTSAGVVSRDGCHVAYWGLSLGIEFSSWDAYTWNRCAPGSLPELVSVTSPSLDGCCGLFSRLAISGDGRYIAYASAVDGPSTTRVWAADTVTHTEQEMEGSYRSPAQVQDLGIDIADDGSFIAVDGQFVAPAATASVVYGWVRGAPDTTIMSGRPNGSVPAGAVTVASDPSISADGRLVAYSFYDGGRQQVMLEDRIAGTVRPISGLPGSPVDSFGASLWGSSPDITPDGTQVAYSAEYQEATTTVYVVRSTSGTFDTAAYELVSIGADGSRADAGDPSISSTGRDVGFVSDDGDALSGDAGFPDGFDVWMQERPPALTGSSALDFGALTIGTSSGSQLATITNDSNVIVPVDTVVAPGGPFSITADACSGAVLQPAASCTVGIAFTPGAAGPADAALVVTGEGAAASIAVHGVGLTPGALTLTPSAHDFGVASLGTQLGATALTVTNTGGSPLGVAAVGVVGAAADQFVVDVDGCTGVTLAAGQTCQVDVSATPTREGPQSAQLRVSGTNGQSLGADLQVRGNVPAPPSTSTTTSTTIPPPQGELGLSPASFDFGTAQVGTALPTKAFTATNTGGQTLTVTNVTLGGGGSAQFAITANGCAGVTLAPNATCQIQIASTPTQVVVSTATLTATGSGGQTDSSTLTVEGTLKIYTPRLVMNPGVARPGQVTTAIGTAFPPGAVVQIGFAGEVPFATVTADATGALSAPLLILRNTKLVGGYDIVALDQPEFTGVRAPLLVDQASFQPSGSNDAGFTNGLRSLYGRGG
jgi:hypothetical protein